MADEDREKVALIDDSDDTAGSTIEENARCFINTPDHSWVLGKVASLDGKKRIGGWEGVLFSAKSDKGAAYPKLKGKDIFCFSNPDIETADNHDLLSLTILHDSTIMNTLYIRYFKDIIYTNIGAITVAFNPFNFKIPWYQDDNMPKYLTEGHTIKDNIPHSWAVAHNTYWELIDMQTNQTILVSGESGAGKTVAAKIVMHYIGKLSSSRGTPEQQALVEQVAHRIKQASPIMEGFGNAATVRNDNSSRFGKFMKIQFDTEGFLLGAFTIKYLLEKSRIIVANAKERIYHSYYLLCLGKDHADFLIDDAKNFKAPNSGGTLKPTSNPNLPDDEDYIECLAAFKDVGVEDKDVPEIWKLLAGILHFQNMEMKSDGKEGTSLEGKDGESLKKVAQLWGIDYETFAKEMTQTQFELKGEVTTKIHAPGYASDVRDALCKTLYDCQFQWLVDAINRTTNNEENCVMWIGLLDIFGFECFELNSFEQICINLANETLQGHYNDYIFRRDIEECKGEGIDVSSIPYPDNSPCIKMVTYKGGIFSMLDEQCKLGEAGSDAKFYEAAVAKCTGNPFFHKGKLDKTKFTIRHYAGDVPYEVCEPGWKDKNADTLKPALRLLMRNSTSDYLKELLDAPMEDAKKITVSGFYKQQLVELMDLIEQTNPHWIRTIKPHPAKKPLYWDGLQVINQLASSGVIGTVKVRKMGYPVRIHFPPFYNRFRLLKPGKPADIRTWAGEILYDVMKFDKKRAQVGTQRVFLKSEEYVLLEDAIKPIMSKCAITAQRYFRQRVHEITLRKKEFETNKDVILERLRFLMGLQKEEIEARKAIPSEEEQEWRVIQAEMDKFGFQVIGLSETTVRSKLMKEQEDTFNAFYSEMTERADKLEEHLAAERAEVTKRQKADQDKLLKMWQAELARVAAKEKQDFAAWKASEQASRMLLEGFLDDEASRRQDIIESYWLNSTNLEDMIASAGAAAKKIEETRLAKERMVFLQKVYQYRRAMFGTKIELQKQEWAEKNQDLKAQRFIRFLNQQPMPGGLLEREMCSRENIQKRLQALKDRDTQVDSMLMRMRDRQGTVRTLSEPALAWWLPTRQRERLYDLSYDASGTLLTQEPLAIPSSMGATSTNQVTRTQESRRFMIALRDLVMKTPPFGSIPYSTRDPAAPAPPPPASSFYQLATPASPSTQPPATPGTEARDPMTPALKKSAGDWSPIDGGHGGGQGSPGGPSVRSMQGEYDPVMVSAGMGGAVSQDELMDLEVQRRLAMMKRNRAAAQSQRSG